MSISIELREPALGYSLLAVSGEVDMGSASQMREKLTPTLEAGPDAVIIDLSLVTYMDSSGIATLVEALQSSMKREIVFRLAALNPAVLDVFRLARLDTVFSVYETTQAALEDPL